MISSFENFHLTPREEYDRTATICLQAIGDQLIAMMRFFAPIGWVTTSALQALQHKPRQRPEQARKACGGGGCVWRRQGH
jgi:hypothetical protein